jgi:hypothetical protein
MAVLVKSPVKMSLKTPISEMNKKRYSIDKGSPFKSSKMLKSMSREDLSTNYSKNVIMTARRTGNTNKANDYIGQAKSLARGSTDIMNSPNKSMTMISVSPRKFRDTTLNEIADETSVNFNKCFMDEYYASNGYFSFSANRQEMRGKDTLYDKLQSFVDARLLEIATSISVKKRAEELKYNQIDKLTICKDEIGIFIRFYIFRCTYWRK